MTPDSIPDPEGPAIREAIGDARRALLLAAADDPLADECCASLCSADRPDGTHLLCVAIGESPVERLDAWRAHAGGPPAKTGFITVGEPARLADAASGAAGPGPEPVSVDSVADPADLTALSRAIGDFLDDCDDPAVTPVVCFHSVTALLDHAGVMRVFRFLHSTMVLLHAEDAMAHFHLDPARHEASAIDTLNPLFDAVVRIEGDGSVSVNSR